MKKKLIKLVLTSLMVGSCFSMQAQEAKSEIPKGSAIVQGFWNLHTGLDAESHNLGFELERSYIGYQYKMANGLSIKGVMDIGNPKGISDYQRLAYIKNAMVSWKIGGLTLNGGLISTTQFNLQEKTWGYRYIMKSFQDLYKFGSSADLGLSADYKFCNWLSADAIIVNGEGYKKLQVKDGLNYGLGLTVTPIQGLHARFYGSINQAAYDGQENTLNGAFALGYKTDRLMLGAEYNVMQNAGFTTDSNLYGYSFYASGRISSTVDVYARYDQLNTNDPLNAKDESALILGLQMKLGQYVKLAPNFRMTMPKTNGHDNSYAAYISCYFGF